jgi:adenylylsulfate kinase
MQSDFKQTRGVTLWFTGLPCSGKTTVCEAVHKELKQRGMRVELLDGDVVRQSLTKGLGFSLEDRFENLRRIGFVANLLTRNGVIVLTATVSPYRAIRDELRQKIGSFFEIYANAPLDVCVKRDVKGMYKKAIAGEIKQFTGISDPYEAPLNPELVLPTAEEPLEASVHRVLRRLEDGGFIPAQVLQPFGTAEEEVAIHSRLQSLGYL